MLLNAPLPDLSTIEEQLETIETLHQTESNTSASGHAPQEENAFNYDQYWLEPNGLGEAQLTYLPPRLRNLEVIQDLVDPLNHIIDDFPAGCEEEKPSYYQFLMCWIRHSPMRVKNDKYFVVNPETQTWGVRQDIAHYIELSIVALALVLQSLHQVVEQTMNTVLWPFILDPHDRYMKALASQKTKPLLRYYNVMCQSVCVVKGDRILHVDSLHIFPGHLEWFHSQVRDALHDGKVGIEVLELDAMT